MKKDKDPKKLSIKDLKDYIAKIEKKFPEVSWSALMDTYIELSLNEKVDKDKIPTSEEAQILNITAYVIDLKNILLDKATEVAASLEKNTKDAKEKEEGTLEERLTGT